MIMDYLKQLFFPGQVQGKEYLGIAAVLLLFFVFPQLVRLLDVSAAPIDPGALSAIVMAVLAVLIFKLTTWWLIRIIWPALAVYANFHFETNFKSLLPCQKVIIFLSFYGFLLCAFILALTAIL
jgi:hypothetical protein